MQETCPSCGAAPHSTGATTLLRCHGCGARFAGRSTTTLELSVRVDAGIEQVQAVLDLDPEFRTRFELDRVIGSGGMGMVLLARETATDRPVAIKFMRMLESPELTDRFLREARLLLSVRHPNVVELFALDRVADHPVLVMEYLAGGTLKDRLAARGTLPPVEAVETMLPVLAGLGALHRAGVIHRDLKPENVLFSAGGTPKIADLGIAKDFADAGITATGQVLGTPIYMSPEQVRGDPPAVTSDIYAMGGMLYELLVGVTPFETRNPIELMRLHQFVEPPSLVSRAPHVPPKLASVIHRALSKPASERPASCEDLAKLLAHAIGRQPARHPNVGDTSHRSPPSPAPPAPTPAPSSSPSRIPYPALELASSLLDLASPAPSPASPPSPAAETLIRKPVPVPVPTAFWTCTVDDGAPISLAPEPLFIGRSFGPSELILEDPGVSYRHALLVPEDTELRVMDFKSTNGLLLNGRPTTDHELAEGDVVSIGAHRLRFRRTAAADAPVAPPPEYMLTPDELTSWLEADADARDRFGIVLDVLSARWALARAVLLAEHLPSGTFQTLAARPASATASPAALRDLPTARLYGGADPVLVVTGDSGAPAALIPLRAGEHTVGQLYLESSAATPSGLLAAEGVPVLRGVAGVLALAVELALPRARSAGSGGR